MTEIYDLVRDSMKAGGVPSPLIANAELSLPDDEEQEKVTTAAAMMKTKPLLLVTGLESPKKELICAKIMRKLMIANNKNGLWLSPAKVPLSAFKEDALPQRGITVILGMDLLLPFQKSVICQLMRDRLPAGALFIVSIAKQKAFNGVVGAAAVPYFSHYAAALEIHSDPAQVFKV